MLRIRKSDDAGAENLSWLDNQILQMRTKPGDQKVGYCKCGRGQEVRKSVQCIPACPDQHFNVHP